MKRTLYEWLRKGHQRKNPKNKGEKIGCLAATLDNNNVVRVGYSKCNKIDTFDEEVAFFTALKRTQSKILDCFYSYRFGIFNIDFSMTNTEVDRIKNHYVTIDEGKFLEERGYTVLEKDEHKWLVSYPTYTKEYVVPHLIVKNLPSFLYRVSRYFKDKEFPLYQDYLYCKEKMEERIKKMDSW